MNSLRRRLLIWLLPATLCVGVLASVGTYWGATLELADLLDGQLQYVADHVSLESDGLRVDPTNDYKRRLSDDSADEILLEVWQGPRLVYTSDPAQHLAAPTHTGFGDVASLTRTWHTVVTHRDDKLIRVAQPKDERWETLARVAVHLVWPVVALIPLLAVFLWIGIGHGLKPLRQIAAELSRRDAGCMSAVTPDPLPSEVRPLVDALNDMLRRLESAFTAQRAFIADAAHELRTPAMALSVHADLAQRAETPDEREAAMAQLRQGVSRLGHLAQQLLTLARLDPDTGPSKPGSVDLVAMCKSVILEYVHRAESGQLDLGLAERDAAVVPGDAGSLHILLGNLIDNAILYTPRHGRIDVATRQETDCVVLEVRDDGPGIPAEERTRVLERFYRGRNVGQPGSGLGLSIVKRIADQHGASISLDATRGEHGLRVSIRFPKSAALE